MEAEILKKFHNVIGFATLYGYGTQIDYNYMIMSYLGCNFETLIKKYKKLSQKLTGLFCYQMVCRIEQFHKKNLIHRDIKPENFILGVEK